MDTTDPPQPTVLIADDQPHILTALQLLLKTEGFSAEVADSPDAVVQALSHHQFDLLLMDMNYARDTTSGREGLDLVARIRAADDSLPVVAMTGWATLDLAVEAMRNGFCDFVMKPWDNSRLVETVRREVAKGRERRTTTEKRGRDFEAARSVQLGLLPEDATIDGWEVATTWQPAEGVGGDYFDVIRFSPTCLGIAIGDVVGKGVAAALLMSNLQAVVRAVSGERVAPADVCARVNRAMCGKMGDMRFVTFLYALLDSAAGTLTWSNAGHNPALVVHRDGSSSTLADGGVVVGLFPDSLYTEQSIAVTAGDCVVLYTDGITEVVDASDEEFGEERLASVVVKARTKRAAPLRDVIVSSVSAFCGGRFQDDATLVVLTSSAKAGAHAV